MSMPRHPQKGFVLLAMVSAVLIAVAVTLSIRLLDAATAKSGQAADLNGRMQRIKDALVQFAMLNGRLPCPANGALVNDPGTAAPSGAVNACTPNQTAGVVPWAELGIPRVMSLDPWGRKITYRVFDGVNSLTRANGVGCVAPCTATLLTVRRTGLPDATDVAFVLVSHGASGLGAWLPQGGRMSLPVSNVEQANYSAAGPFNDLTRTDPSVPPTAATHFDDTVHYMTLDALATAAGRK